MKIVQNLTDTECCTCSEHACIRSEANSGWVVHPVGIPSLLFKGLELASDLGWSYGGSLGGANGSCWAEYQPDLTSVLFNLLNIRAPTCSLDSVIGYLPAMEGDWATLSEGTQRA